MNMNRLLAVLLAMLLLSAGACAELLESLPMDDLSIGPAPKTEHYVFDQENSAAAQTIGGSQYRPASAYADESISVQIYTGRYPTGGKNGGTDYTAAHVKIAHPSQLRTAPGGSANKDGKFVAKGSFKSNSTWRGRLIASAVNAVVSINGDYHTKVKEGCKVMLRQSTQLRNLAVGERDLLIIDKNGDFSSLEKPDQAAYEAFYQEHRDSLYQVLCFGPVLVRDGESQIDEDFWDHKLSKKKDTRAARAAIAQLGTLDYLLITCDDPESKGNDGMTAYEFGQFCQDMGRMIYPETGCLLAYNLDGGNSTTMNFLGYSEKNTKTPYRMMKINNPEEERFLSDIIYFATLEK